jgi:tetratricopeptide (TPR) repeat protein
MADMQAVPSPEQLPVPVRMEGIGNSHITIKATAEAQVWFDQGLNLLHDFWDYESQKAFEQGIRVDPNCAMCWWGLARAEGFWHGNAQAYGKKALAQAARLKDHAGSSDKLYIEAAQAELNAKEDDSPEATVIYRKLVKKNPRDTQARIFLAESLCDGYDDAGEPKSGQKECIAILEGVLKDAPNDSAANHYWIHAIEPGEHPDHALNSAALLASLAPNSGHMVHMPGHIYYRVGNYPEAERWFTASTKVDEKYMREQRVSPDNDWNYAHNMMYAIANLMEQGRLADANAMSDRLAGARGKLSDSLYIWSARDQVSRISDRLPVALRVGDWDAVLTMLSQVSLEGDKTANLRTLAAELTQYATGMKALASGDLTAAQAASDQLDAGLWRLQQRQKSEALPKKRLRPTIRTRRRKSRPWCRSCPTR